VFDAVIDPVIGAASDETRSRMGRRRPWMIVALPLCVVFNILQWSTWPSMAGNDAALFAYYLMTACMLAFSLTLFYIPYTALVVTVSSRDVDRTRLSTARTGNIIFGDILAVGMVTLCTSLITDTARAYQVAAAGNALIVVTVILITFFGVPEPSSLHVRGCQWLLCSGRVPCVSLCPTWRPWPFPALDLHTQAQPCAL
jgi:glycoside/pentoside/hexuronide:cation symporter, GPH family